MKRFFLIPLVLAGMFSSTATAVTLAKKKKTSRASAVRKRKPKLGPRVDPTIGDNVDGEDLVFGAPR